MNGLEEQDRGYMGEDYWEMEETIGAKALRSDKFGVFRGWKEGQCGEW